MASRTVLRFLFFSNDHIFSVYPPAFSQSSLFLSLYLLFISLPVCTKEESRLARTFPFSTNPCAMTLTRSPGGRTPYSTAFNANDPSICARIKNICFNFRRSPRPGTPAGDDGASEGGGSSEYNTVQSLDYDDMGDQYQASYLGGSTRSIGTGHRPGFLSIHPFSCTNPFYTPEGPPEPIIVDMNDFELIFEPAVCEICKSG